LGAALVGGEATDRMQQLKLLLSGNNLGEAESCIVTETTIAKRKIA
jgi:hypothetical protein